MTPQVWRQDNTGFSHEDPGYIDHLVYEKTAPRYPRLVQRFTSLRTNGPVLVPFAIFLVEPRIWRRKAISVFVALGLSVGLSLLFFILRFPVTARVRGDSISYDSPHFYLAVVIVAYLTATCITGLFSSHWCINVFGVLAFILAIAAAVVSLTTFVSVWCFYAAVLSLLVYLHFSGPMQACRDMLPPARSQKQAPMSRHPGRPSR